MDDFATAAFRERRAHRTARRRALLVHVAVWITVNVFLVVVWALSGGGTPWFLYVLFGWGIGVAAHAATALLATDPDDILLADEERRLRAEPPR